MPPFPLLPISSSFVTTIFSFSSLTTIISSIIIIFIYFPYIPSNFLLYISISFPFSSFFLHYHDYSIPFTPFCIHLRYLNHPHTHYSLPIYPLTVQSSVPYALTPLSTPSQNTTMVDSDSPMCLVEGEKEEEEEEVSARGQVIIIRFEHEG